jgi:hypothetical protein
MKPTLEPEELFRKNDPVWWDPVDPLKARDPLQALYYGMMGMMPP